MYLQILTHLQYLEYTLATAMHLHVLSYIDTERGFYFRNFDPKSFHWIAS
jgi:hypothetical protein